MADNALKRRNALMDASQGVSKGFWADGLGGPVDMMTTLANLGIAGGGYAGHKLGLLSQPPELIQNPVGGSEWIAQQMRQRGLLNDNPGSTADSYGRVAGGLLAPLTAARAPQIANALQQTPAALQRGAYAVGERAAGMAENQLVKQGGILPATVWHGSPHKFDKFDAGKIGTGEGAQAYGHGLYFADSPSVAKFYQNQYGTPEIREGGRLVDASRLDPSTARGHALSQLQSQGGSVDDVIAGLDGMTKHGPEYKAAADWLRKNMANINFEHGSLYKVDLPDEQIAKMLDWDKPLSQQAPGVQKVLASVMEKRAAEAEAQRLAMNAQSPGRLTHPVLGKIANKPRTALDYKGDAAVSALVQELGGPAKASDFLRANGIPGIRYLDGGSRSSGQGSSNFVVFPGNEGLLSILERNGQAPR